MTKKKTIKPAKKSSNRKLLYGGTLTILVVILGLAAYGLFFQRVQEIEILSHSGFVVWRSEPELAHYVVVGEIKNTGITFLKNVSLRVTLYSSDNEPLITLNCTAYLEVLPPGRTSPFSLLWYGKEKSFEVENYVISIASYETHPEGKPEGLKIFGTDFRLGRVLGNIENVGDKDAMWVKIVAAFYDENGKVVAANTELIQRIAPGAVEEFEVPFPFPEEDLPSPPRKGFVTAESREYAHAIESP